jgi:16S rRNA (cytosine1402-N4)-methyltransferase
MLWALKMKEMTSQTKYHEPVMLKESTEALEIKPNGVYVDVTYGGGGHSKEIIKHLKTGKLMAFDQDQDSQKQLVEDDKIVFINHNFRYVTNFLKMYDVLPVDGLLADLGISSHQIDTNDRGFAFRSDGPLDMRMNRNSELTAAKILNEYEEYALTSIFRMYGELKNAKRLAYRIVSYREDNKLDTTSQLISCLEKEIPQRFRNKILAKIFQALRIEVNGEMDVLKELLLQCSEVIKEDGRISIITYHSLEDRLVKNYIRSGNFEGDLEKDFYGNVIKPFEAINRKPIIPTEEEINTNNRARSAKLRVAKRVAGN